MRGVELGGCGIELGLGRGDDFGGLGGIFFGLTPVDGEVGLGERDLGVDEALAGGVELGAGLGQLGLDLGLGLVELGSVANEVLGNQLGANRLGLQGHGGLGERALAQAVLLAHGVDALAELGGLLGVEREALEGLGLLGLGERARVDLRLQLDGFALAQLDELALVFAEGLLELDFEAHGALGGTEQHAGLSALGVGLSLRGLPAGLQGLGGSDAWCRLGLGLGQAGLQGSYFLLGGGEGGLGGGGHRLGFTAGAVATAFLFDVGGRGNGLVGRVQSGLGLVDFALRGVYFALLFVDLGLGVQALQLQGVELGFELGGAVLGLGRDSVLGLALLDALIDLGARGL